MIENSNLAVKPSQGLPPNRRNIYRRTGLMVLMGFLYVAAIHLTGADALQAYIAATELKLDPERNSLLNSIDSNVQLTRQTQQHFLKYGVYIPIEDIIIDSGAIESIHLNLLRQTCGRGYLYVWVPLKFRFPLIGEKVSEWCLVLQK